jgi:hypothetical protein
LDVERKIESPATAILDRRAVAILRNQPVSGLHLSH